MRGARKIRSGIQNGGVIYLLSVVRIVIHAILGGAGGLGAGTANVAEVAAVVALGARLALRALAGDVAKVTTVVALGAGVAAALGKVALAVVLHRLARALTGDVAGLTACMQCNAMYDTWSKYDDITSDRRRRRQ